MKNDLLDEATRALRVEGERPAVGARFTRGRVLASLRAKRRRRATTLKIVIPLAAMLVGGTTLAAVGGKLPTAWIGEKNETGSNEEPTPTAESTKKRPSVTRTLATPPAEPNPTLSAEPAPTPTAEAARSIAELKTSEPVAKTKPLRPVPLDVEEKKKPPPPDETLLLYRAAHQAHFVDQLPATALAKWDEYLALAPRGRFAVEARYNRALCLVRLGRAAQARAALEPFARGTFGAYRRQEARELIAALDGNQSSKRP